MVAVLVTFTVGYTGYSRYLSRFVELDDERETPAHKYEDGQEYVPSKKPVLLGHHFSSIAGGAPIVGPITAGVIWGWVPAMLWIAIGNPLMGAVHDFISLSSSIRHEGRSIGYIVGQYVGERGKNLLLWFAFLTIILVVAVFALVVGIVFNAYPQVTTASTIYVALALVFGVYLYQLNGPFVPGTILFVAGVFAGVWVGIQYPFALFELAEGSHPAGTFVLFSGTGDWVPGAAALGGNTAGWIPLVMLYAGIASALPVWVLLQPRDYLSSFLLYSGVGGGVLAIIVGTILGTSSQPLVISDSIGVFEGFWGVEAAGLFPLFPLLFITIACGTISGFHSLVSSGTTAKQLDKETDARLIGYGGMLGEGLLATTAIVTVAVYASAPAGGGIGLALPNFATGGGIVLTSYGLSQIVGATFMGLVLVSFLLTSTDTAVRLGRYMFEEAVGTPETTVEKWTANRYVNSALQAVPAYLLVATGSWADLWPLFGGANQTLAALALLIATVWLANWDDSKQLISTGAPMAFMLAITVTAITYLAVYQNFFQKYLNPAWRADAGALDWISIAMQIIISGILVYIAVSLLKMGYDNVLETRREPAVAADGGEPSDD
jgi:carbon starvation protein